MKRLPNSFQFRLVLSTVLVIILTGLAILLYVGFSTVSNIRREREQDLVHVAQAQALNASSWEEKAILALINLSRQPDIISMQAIRQEPVLTKFSDIYQDIYLASTTNLDGINVARSDGKEPKDYHDRPWFLGAATGNDLTRQTLISRTNNEPALCHSTPIRDDQQLAGVLVTCANLTKLTEAVGATKVGDTGFVFLVNEQGQVLAHPQFASSSELVDLSAYPPVKALLAGQDGLITFTDEAGIAWLSQVMPLNNGWGVVAQQTRSEVLRPVWIAVLIGSLVVVLAVVVGSIAARFLVKRMVDPLNDLTQTAAIFAEGDFDHRATAKGGDELNLLATTFNAMVDQIQATHARITTHNKRLESMVELNESLSAVLDSDWLLPEAAKQLTSRLGYDQVQFYMLADDRHDLVLTEAAGGAGIKLKAENYTISVDAPASPVARAARTDQVVLVSDVEQADVWSPTPHLTSTQAEVAVPIQLDGQVVGVLDVQVDQPGGLDSDDANLLRSVANQVAITMRNARLFAEVEQSLADAQSVQEQYTRQTWDRDRIGTRGNKNLYIQPEAPDLPVEKRAEAKRKALLEEKPALLVDDEPGAEAQSIVAPVILGTNTIGTMQLHHIGSFSDSQTWTQEDLALVQAVLDQLAQTAENLRLFDETRRRAGQEATIREITDKLRSAPNLKDLVQTASEELGSYLSATHVKLKLGLESPANDHTSVVSKTPPPEKNDKETSVNGNS